MGNPAAMPIQARLGRVMGVPLSVFIWCSAGVTQGLFLTSASKTMYSAEGPLGGAGIDPDEQRQKRHHGTRAPKRWLTMEGSCGASLVATPPTSSAAATSAPPVCRGVPASADGAGAGGS